MFFKWLKIPYEISLVVMAVNELWRCSHCLHLKIRGRSAPDRWQPVAVGKVRVNFSVPVWALPSNCRCWSSPMARSVGLSRTRLACWSLIAKVSPCQSHSQWFRPLRLCRHTSYVDNRTVRELFSDQRCDRRGHRPTHSGRSYLAVKCILPSVPGESLFVEPRLQC